MNVVELENASSWTIRHEVPSNVPFKIDLKSIKVVVASLLMAASQLLASMQLNSVMSKCFNDGQPTHLTEFFSSEHFFTNLSFGERCLEQSSENELLVPSCSVTKENSVQIFR
jgi:hypothetical protein